jgi:hypothetical protein
VTLIAMIHSQLARLRAVPLRLRNDGRIGVVAPIRYQLDEHETHDSDGYKDDQDFLH